MLVNFQFAAPYWLWLFIPVLALMYGLWRQRVNQQQAGQGIIAAHLAAVFSVQNRQRANNSPILLTLLTASLIILALSGPSWSTSDGDKIKAPLVVALDLSSSMLESQQELTQLERAKLMITQVLAQAGARPISLVAFAGSSHQVLPSSKQYQLLTLYLGYMQPEVMPIDGNNLNSLVTVISSMSAAKDYGFDILLVTDGANSDSNELTAFLKQQNADGIVAALTPSAEGLASELNLALISTQQLTRNPQEVAEQVTRLTANAIAKSSMLVNHGYWLLYPAALLLLLFFRRGFSLYWTAVIVLSISLSPTPVQAQTHWLDWFMTADQQGQFYFNRDDFKEAAIRFNDPEWKAFAHYKAKEYAKAAKIYRELDSPESLFNLAMSYTRGRNYSKAQQLYELLLEIDPDNQAAETNLRVVINLIRDIKQLGESQQEENPPESINPDEMTDSNLGADKQTVGKIEVTLQKLSVAELLRSDSKKQQWLRDISKDPQQFLAAKFQAEYNQSISVEEDAKAPSAPEVNVDD